MLRDLRVGTQRPSPTQLSVGAVRSNNQRGCLIVLDPPFEPGDHVERVRSRATTTVPHTRHEKQARRIRVLRRRADCIDDLPVVVDRRLGREVLIGPAVIEQQFAPAPHERAEIGTRIDYIDPVRLDDGSLEVESAQSQSGLLKTAYLTKSEPSGFGSGPPILIAQPSSVPSARPGKIVSRLLCIVGGTSLCSLKPESQLM